MDYTCGGSKVTMASSSGQTGAEEGLFCEDWTAKEELQLLETVEEFGYGNWGSVSDKMRRPAEECHLHYDLCYLNNPHPLLPALPQLVEPQPSTSQLISSLDNRDNNPVPPYYGGEEIGCYMPHRGDFSVEPLNTAEWLVADVEYDEEEEEDQLISVLKLAAVRIYWDRLKQRTFRKWMVREYGLIDIRRETATDRIKLTRNQIGIKRQLRPFMRFMPPQTAFKLIQSLFLAEEIKEEIARLKGYRENGITTKQGAELCEHLRRRRKLMRRQHGESLKIACTAEESIFSQLILRRTEEKTMSVKEKQQSAALPHDISRLSGVERLSSDERELCQTCRLHPEALLGYLTQLEGERKRCGQLKLSDARRLLKIDVNKTRKIFNYLVSQGRNTCP